MIQITYLNNKPNKCNDPSGHNPILIFAMLILAALILSADTPHEHTQIKYPINDMKSGEASTNCSCSLSDCFGDQVGLKYLKGFGKENPIPFEVFIKFSEKVANDLATHDVDWPGLMGGREAYDTPFYNGGQSEKWIGDENSINGFYDSNKKVCIETIRCSGRSEITNISQGMWGARTREPKGVLKIFTRTWKFVENKGQKPSEDTLFLARIWLRLLFRMGEKKQETRSR